MFADVLMSCRIQSGLSQAELAEKVNVLPATVARWESGKSLPKLHVVYQLEAILATRQYALFDEWYASRTH